MKEACVDCDQMLLAHGEAPKVAQSREHQSGLFYWISIGDFL